jgi:uncharacterized phage-associated protein
MTAPYPIKAIADYFLSLSEPDTGDVMTHLRLQKLAYYAQGWHLALKNEPLFTNALEAWPHGPVSPALWGKFKDFGFDAIPRTAISTTPSSLDADSREVLDDVWSVYGQFSGKRLEEMTHNEVPWKNARGNLPPEAKSNSRLSHADMKKYFSDLLKSA